MTKELWLGGKFPGIFVRDPAPRNCWGETLASKNPKFCLHTTEGPLGLYRPFQGSYYGHQYWPHGTLFKMENEWKFAQHIPLPFSAKALQNRTGGVETNKLNVFQVEIACKALGAAALPRDALRILAKVAAWLHDVAGLPLQCRVAFKAYPGSYGPANGVRLNARAWMEYSGILGHQHVPENDHGDPGNFPITVLLEEISKLTAGEEDMPITNSDAEFLVGKLVDLLSTSEPRARLLRGAFADTFLDVLREHVFDVEPPIRQGNAGNVIGATYNKVGDAQAALKDLREMVIILANNQHHLSEAMGDLARNQNQVALLLGEIKVRLVGEHTPIRPYEAGETKEGSK